MYVHCYIISSIATSKETIATTDHEGVTLTHTCTTSIQQWTTVTTGVVPFTHFQWRTGPHLVTVTVKEDCTAQLNKHDGNWWEISDMMMCVVQSGACTW